MRASVPEAWFGREAAWIAALLLAAAAGGAEARQPWVVLKDCRLVSNESADADSFHVKAGGKEYIFRLYFVDAPETDTEFPSRVDEQAKYFGLTEAQTIQLGKYAKRFTREKLNRPFTVRTCMQDAMGRSRMDRYYAFVETEEGDLAELLVTNGLARLHGSTATPTGLSSPERMWEKLQRLEQRARQEKVGGWGASSGRLAARSRGKPPKSGPDSFEAFFHPEKSVLAREVESRSKSLAAVSGAAGTPSGEKLDINSATLSELLNIPGVGPVLAQRIVDARPFGSADGLSGVKGVGAKTYERIRPYFR